MVAARSAAWPRGRAIRLEGVTVRRGGRAILDGVDVAFEPGRRYVLIGASGAGKSTLVRLLNRLEDPAAGSICVGDVPVVALPVLEVRRQVGLVFQNPRPLPGTLGDHLRFGFEARGIAPPGRSRLEAALAEVGLDAGWLERDAGALSGGERQRLALAAMLGMGPEILVLDEPTAALDPASARLVVDLLDRRCREDGLRTIVVTHDRAIAPRLGDRGVRLEGGRVVDVGPIGDVLVRAEGDR